MILSKQLYDKSRGLTCRRKVAYQCSTVYVASCCQWMVCQKVLYVLKRLCESSYHSFYHLAHNEGVVPSQYIFISEQNAAVNGSLAAENCSDIVSAGSTTACRQPASSVLFDGTILTLTGLSGNMWASQQLL